MTPAPRLERRPFNPDKARERAADAAYEDPIDVPRKHRAGFGKAKR